MNKLIITIATTLLLTTSVSVLAQDEPTGERSRKGDRHQGGMQAMPVADKLMRAVRHLDLSDEQKESIRTIAKGMKTDMRTIMHETRAGHIALQELLKSDVYDEEAVAVIAEQEGDLAAERLMITSRAMSEVYKQLTDEQRIELESMAANHRQNRGERRQKGVSES